MLKLNSGICRSSNCFQSSDNLIVCDSCKKNGKLNSYCCSCLLWCKKCKKTQCNECFVDGEFCCGRGVFNLCECIKCKNL